MVASNRSRSVKCTELMIMMKSSWSCALIATSRKRVVVVSAARKTRGRRTEHVVAAYFAKFWERAVAVNSGASGSDVLNTPFDIEVKARAAFQPKAWIDQQKNRDDGKLKFIVMRCNGQGENPEDYVFIARLGDIMPLLEDKVPSDDIVRCKGCGVWMTLGKECEVCAVLKTTH